VNFFAESVDHSRDRRLRAHFHDTDKALYAIYDFDMAVVFSGDASASECRLPRWMSFQGVVTNRPQAIAEGEIDYDPFAWDVGCLGIALCEEFQVGPLIPERSPADAVWRST
jgi:hypothetical protein